MSAAQGTTRRCSDLSGRELKEIAAAHTDERLAMLDGWRAVSILLVLACHLLPLGPKSWQLNDMAGPMGMSIFFTLSGFLITRFLLHHDSVPGFLIRRIFRIVPLAWVGLLVALPMGDTSPNVWWSNFLFVANLPPIHLSEIAGHYWSLCIEVQFYVGIAILFAMFGVRGLYLLPVVCIAITLHRVSAGTIVDIVTARRIDEILAGCTLAMVVGGRFGTQPQAWLRVFNAPLLLCLLVVCSHPSTGFMNYFRPYVASLLVGSTIYGTVPPLAQVLESRFLAYVAKVSFALYVIHHILIFTWLGTGPDKIIKYAKRPLLFAATFVLAHLSTFHFEERCINFGKRLSARWLA